MEYLLPSDEDDAAAVTKRAEVERILQGNVKSLKDVVEIKFEVDEEHRNDANGVASKMKERFVCPMTNNSLGPGSKAVYLVPCGHAFSAVAIKETSGEAKGKCLQCNEGYAPNDVIPIIPTSETDIARLQLRIKTLKEQGLHHSLKKDKSASKKRKKDKNGESKEERINGVNGKGNDEAPALVPAVENGKRNRSNPASGRSTPQPSLVKKADGIKNAATASLTAKVLQEQEARNKRRKIETNDNIKSLFHNKEQKASLTNSADFMTRGYTVPTHKK